jgi:hypothetical protein
MGDKCGIINLSRKTDFGLSFFSLSGGSVSVRIEAWKLFMGDEQSPPELVRFVDFPTEMWRTRFLVKGKEKDEIEVEEFNIRSWLANRSATFNGNMLTTLSVPRTYLTSESGILLFIVPFAPASFRLHKPARLKPPMSEDQLRIETIYADLLPNELRDAHRSSLPKRDCYLVPGHDGFGLVRYGVRVLSPVSEAGINRAFRQPYEAILLISLDAKIEIVTRYVPELGFPNWMEIGVMLSEYGVEPYAMNIRNPNLKWMREAAEKMPKPSIRPVTKEPHKF